LLRRIKIKHNYLNNKDILKEIHRSKSTYCTFTLPDYADYDIIIHDLLQITADNIRQAQENRAERLAKLQLEAAAALGEKRKLDEFLLPTEEIPTTDVIFRVMTWAHVPINKAATKKSQDAADEEAAAHTEYDDDADYKVPAAIIKYTKCNFPPFQHYKIDSNGVSYCVGKSHWKGDMDAGEWSRDHGSMTKKLALMFMKLCERYATRSNWRGYTYNDEMRSQALLQLSQIGLQFDESKSQNPFAYYTAAITNSFTRVLNIEKRNQNLRDDILEMNNFNPSYTRQGMSSGYTGGSDGDHD
jgi:hypothetical protein